MPVVTPSIFAAETVVCCCYVVTVRRRRNITMGSRGGGGMGGMGTAHDFHLHYVNLRLGRAPNDIFMVFQRRLFFM